MKTSHPINKIAAIAVPCLAIALSLVTVSCGAPDPNVQKQMDADIMSASQQKKAPGAAVGPKYMEGSQGYGLGSY